MLISWSKTVSLHTDSLERVLGVSMQGSVTQKLKLGWGLGGGLKLTVTGRKTTVEK